MRQKSKKGVTLCAGAFLVIFLIASDQITKKMAVLHLKNAPAVPILPGIFELSYLENRGAAFGILQGQRTLFLALTAAALVILAYLYVCIPKRRHYAYMHFVIILFISGAAGNFIDRLTRDYVVDFFYFKLINFPVFNVADIYVTAAAALLIFLFCFYYTEEDIEMVIGKLLFWKGKDNQRHGR